MRPPIVLTAEVEAMHFVFEEVAAGHPLPVAEAEAVSHALVLQARPRPGMLPQAVQEDPADYMAVHAVNVAALAIAFAESIEMVDAAVRVVALAGLLHDIGMGRMPPGILNREGPLDETERALLKTHPAEGAQLIIAADAGLELPAIVAFEHHVRLDGSGYPELEPRRPPHRMSRMVQLCDIWHALRTPRPYRDAWPPEIVLSFLAERAGFEFDNALTRTFIRLIRRNLDPVL